MTRSPGAGHGRAVASGALLGLAFLPLPLGFLAWFALVPLLRELDDRIAAGERTRSLFATGYAFGLAFYLTGTHWIALLSDVAITVPWLKYPAWLLAGAYLALYPALATTLCGLLVRRARVPLGVVFPLVALSVEELRASGELGFPWFQPGYSQHAYAPVLQLASLGSVSLITLWVLAVNVLIRQAWCAWRAGSRRPAAAAAALLLAPWVWGSLVLRSVPPPAGPAVALVQGNIPGRIKWAGGHEREILRTFLELSRRAVDHPLKPRLVVWPETATGSYLRKQLDQLLDVVEFASRSGVRVFSGFPDYELGPDARPRYYNAAGMFPQEPGSPRIYAKRHLVPFGERMPFQAAFPALGRLDLGQAEWTPGRRATLFTGGTGRFGCLICFEAIFPDLARTDVREGATWLVNITNDEWFGPGAALYQHAAMAVFRSVENHVPLVRTANTGLTLVTDSYGRIVARAPVWRPEFLVARLAAPGPPTPYTRLGDWPGLVSTIGVAILALAGRRRPGLRRSLTARAAGP